MIRTQLALLTCALLLVQCSHVIHKSPGKSGEAAMLARFDSTKSKTIESANVGEVKVEELLIHYQTWNRRGADSNDPMYLIARDLRQSRLRRFEIPKNERRVGSSGTFRFNLSSLNIYPRTVSAWEFSLYTKGTNGWLPSSFAIEILTQRDFRGISHTIPIHSFKWPGLSWFDIRREQTETGYHQRKSGYSLQHESDSKASYSTFSAFLKGYTDALIYVKQADTPVTVSWTTSGWVQYMAGVRLMNSSGSREQYRFSQNGQSQVINPGLYRVTVDAAVVENGINSGVVEATISYP